MPDDVVQLISEEGRAMQLRRTIGDIFLDIRAEQGLTQRQMAEKLDCPQYMVSRIERGTIDLKLSNLQKYMRRAGFAIGVEFIPLED